jgi:hypothetical protein
MNPYRQSDEGMTAIEIHADLLATLKTEAVCDGSVTRYLRSRSFTASIDPRQNESPDSVLTELDKEILAALEERPFASVHQVSRVTHIANDYHQCEERFKLRFPPSLSPSLE